MLIFKGVLNTYPLSNRLDNGTTDDRPGIRPHPTLLQAWGRVGWGLCVYVCMSFATHSPPATNSTRLQHIQNILPSLLLLPCPSQFARLQSSFNTEIAHRLSAHHTRIFS
jgi:hypothetical protein